MYPIVGSEEIAAGRLTRAALRWHYTAIHPNIYLPKDAPHTPDARTESAFLWTERKGVIAGRAAAYWHGVRWALQHHDIEVICKHRRPVHGVEIHDERIAPDEICNHGAQLLVTSPARTAFDVGRRLPRVEAVTVLDALSAVTGVTAAEVKALAARYPASRGIPAAREAVELMDGGARSREETVIRLLLMDSGLPRPSTSIQLEDRHWSTRIAIGWEFAKVGISFEPDGRLESYSAVQQLESEELVQRLGWLHIRAHPWRSLHIVRFRARAALMSRAHRTWSGEWVPTRSAAGT